MKGIDFTQDKSIFLDKKVKVFPSGIYQNTDCGTLNGSLIIKSKV